jgi:hypothetical protein
MLDASGWSWRASQRREACRQLEDGGKLRGTQVRNARGPPGVNVTQRFLVADEKAKKLECLSWKDFAA